MHMFQSGFHSLPAAAHQVSSNKSVPLKPWAIPCNVTFCPNIEIVTHGPFVSREGEGWLVTDMLHYARQLFQDYRLQINTALSNMFHDATVLQKAIKVTCGWHVRQSNGMAHAVDRTPTIHGTQLTLKQLSWDRLDAPVAQEVRLMFSRLLPRYSGGDLNDMQGYETEKQQQQQQH
jgi:hypothetical protein